MAYTKTNWVNDETPINATNLNKIENGIETNDTNISTLDTNIGTLANLETSTTTDLVSAINELYDGMYYKSGDTITGTFQIAGYITSGTKDFYFTIYLPKSMANISSITVNGGSFNVRTTSGAYLNGGAFNYNASGITTTAYIINYNAVTILVRSTSAYTNVTNNTPVAGAVSGFSLEFN